jgi:hypothetical protein
MSGTHTSPRLRISAPAAVPANWTLDVETTGSEVRLWSTYASPCGGKLVLVVGGLRLTAADCTADGRARLTPGPGGVTVEILAEKLLDATGAVGACERLLAALELTTWSAGRVHTAGRSNRDHQPKRFVQRR